VYFEVKNDLHTLASETWEILEFGEHSDIKALPSVTLSYRISVL